jgi:hypothetical protein
MSHIITNISDKIKKMDCTIAASMKVRNHRHKSWYFVVLNGVKQDAIVLVIYIEWIIHHHCWCNLAHSLKFGIGLCNLRVNNASIMVWNDPLISSHEYKYYGMKWFSDTIHPTSTSIMVWNDPLIPFIPRVQVFCCCFFEFINTTL